MYSGELRYGRSVIEAVRSLEPTCRVAVLVRHSVRGEITPEEPDVSLTEEGKKSARLFGRLFPWNRPLLVRMSSMRRCVETAEQIVVGYQQSHPDSSATMLQSEKSLAVMLHSEENQPHMRKLGKFMEKRAWESGDDWNLPPELVAGGLTAAENTIRELSELLRNGSPGCMHLYIDHDFHLMILRDRLFGGELKKKRWVDYLDGLVVGTEDGDEFFTIWGDERTALAYSRQHEGD